jgi:general secretion pathway protein D
VSFVVNNPMRKTTWNPADAGIRLFAAGALSVLLGACASISGENAGTSSTAGAAGNAAPVQSGAAQTIIPVLQTDVANNDQLRDEINRDGRVIQLGRFVETQPTVQAPENNVVELNYEQEDLRLVFEQLGDALDLNMVIDPAIDAKVSLRTSTDNPLRFEDIWPLIRLLARNAGVTIEQAGNVYEFTLNASNIPAEIVLPGSLADASLPDVLQVTPLTYISVEAAEAILNPLLQPEGSIIRLGPANLLGISGTPEQLTRVNALLEVIDDDPFLNQGIQVYELLNSQATTVAEELTNILKLVEGELSSYQVLGLERINAVLVIAPANRGFEEVTRWVRILDAESQEQVEQLFVYRVKNLDATRLAATLTSVFGGDDEAIQRVLPEEAEAASTEQQALPAATTAPAGQVAPATPGAAPAPSVLGVAISANISVTIVADEDTNSLLVRATPREYRQLLATISNLDIAPAQVLINAVIGQVTLTDGTKFGIDWTRVSSNAASGPARLTTRFLPTGLLSPEGLATPGSGLVLTRTFMDGSAVIDATLYAIAQDNEVRLLARPTLLATNKQEGEIKVGQSVPINNGSTVGNGITTENISYRDVGIELRITPQINDDGFVNLQIFQNLSSIEEGSAVGVAGNPTFSNQEITTTVVVSDQSTITLGGLIQEEGSDQNAGVPYLQKLPVLGGLFSYQDQRTARRELFIILRPQIIRGDGSDNQLLQEFRATFTNVGNLLREAGL